MRYRPLDINAIKDFYKRNSDLVCGVLTCGFFSEKEVSNILERHLGDLTHKNVIDIGCGKSDLLPILSLRGIGGYTGLDLNIVSAHHRVYSFPTKFIEGDIHEIRKILPGAKFDIILLLDVVEHSYRLLELFETCRDLLCKGGKILITAPNYINTAGLLKLANEFSGRYAYNTWAPFSCQKSQINETFMTGLRILRMIRRTGFRLLYMEGWDLVGGIYPFLYGERELVGIWGRHSNWYWRINRALRRLFPLLSTYCSMYTTLSAQRL